MFIPSIEQSICVQQSNFTHKSLPTTSLEIEARLSDATLIISWRTFLQLIAELGSRALIIGSICWIWFCNHKMWELIPFG